MHNRFLVMPYAGLYINNIIYKDQALLQHNVPVSFHAFPQGEHAIALRNNPGSTALWTSLCEMWLNETGIIKDIIPVK